ncbi:RNA-directed DNA polymerase, partial [Acinetobacter seifertii]|nr:RNA-directed DNA polymerase [Acinetobacter seifertii]
MTKKVKTALVQVASLANLEEAWDHIWKNSKKQYKNSLDLNKIRLNDFNHNKKQLLKKISKKLLDRSYGFS